MTGPQAPRLREIGYVAGAHGLAGELVVRLHNHQSEVLESADALFLRARGADAPVRAPIAWVRPLAKKGIGVGFEGIGSRTEAERWKGATLLADESDLEPLAEGEFYLEDLRGLLAVAADGHPLGRVVGFMETSVDIAVLERPDGRELLAPLVPGTVGAIDAEAGTVVLDLPEGLEAL